MNEYMGSKERSARVLQLGQSLGLDEFLARIQADTYPVANRQLDERINANRAARNR